MIHRIMERIELAQGSKDKYSIIEEAMHGDESKDLHGYLTLAFGNEKFGFSARTIEKVFKIDKKKTPYFDVGELFALYANHKAYPVSQTVCKVVIDDIRETSGNKCIETLKGYSEVMNNLQMKWLIRSLVHDLKIGISRKGVNKIFMKVGWPVIEKFEVQLCGKITDLENYNKGFPVGVENKYDGMRAILRKKGQDVTFTSRADLIIEYVPELNKFIKDNYDDDFILDGEIDCGDFNLLQSRIGNKKEMNEVPNLHFRVYDILNLNGESVVHLTQEKRTRILKNVFRENERLKITLDKVVHNQHELEEFFNERNDLGEEGIIIKLLDKPYEYDGRKNWWKVKKFFESTVKIIDWSYGTAKNAERIAKIKVKANDIESWVGSGIKDITMEQLKTMLDNNTLIGTFCDVKYQEITNTKAGRSLRFASFLKFRDDKLEADDL